MQGTLLRVLLSPALFSVCFTCVFISGQLQLLISTPGLATFWRWTKGSTEAASVGPTVLYKNVQAHTNSGTFPKYSNSNQEHQSRHDNNSPCKKLQVQDQQSYIRLYRTITISVAFSKYSSSNQEHQSRHEQQHSMQGCMVDLQR